MYADFRRDGWPLCPLCKEDELYSTRMIEFASAVAKGQAQDPADRPSVFQCMRGVMRCYKCGWGSDVLPRRTWMGMPYVVVVGKWPMEVITPTDERNQTGHIEVHGQPFIFGYAPTLEAIHVPIPFGPKRITVEDFR
jgi:hypothetical protein